MISQTMKISQGLAYASGTADRNGATVDMQGFHGLVAIVQLGTIAAGAETTIKLQQGAASNMSDAADILGSSVAIADDDDSTIKYIEIREPRERYVRVVIDKDGSNACAESVTYIQYGPAAVPVTHGTGVAGELHIGPAEGTA
jgi:hypothetical protein